MTHIKEITAKHMLVKSNLPDTNYVVNPYTGCEFGCHYCYASFMGRMVNEPMEEWGNYVYIKANAVQVFQKDIKRLKNQNSSIFFSSVTDCYQGVESKYKLTRKILEILADIRYPGKISILTKSSLVTRDIEIFKRIKSIEVGLTITSTNDKISRFMEVRASDVTARLKALKKLNDHGIKTYAFVGPLLPHVCNDDRLLENIFKQIAEAGTKEVYVEHLNMKPYIMRRLAPALKDESEQIQNMYKNKVHTKEKVYEYLKKYGLKLKTSDTIEHDT